MKRILAVVLCICMVVAVFGGCTSKNNTSSTTSNITSTTSGATQTAAEKAIADRLASGKNTVVNFTFFDWTGAPKGTDRIKGLINAITEKQLGITVDLQCMDATSFRQNVPLMCASGEKLDIFSAGGVGFTSAVNNGYLYDMNKDDLLTTYGAGICDAVDEVYRNACKVGDAQYAVPPVKDMAISAGICCIAAKYLDGIGYDYNSKWSDANKESIKASWEDLEPIFAQLHAKYPDVAIFSSTMSYIGQGTLFDPVGGDYYGALLDPANSLEISDLYASKEFMDICKRFYKYNQLGYYTADCLTSTVPMGAQIGAGTAMVLLSQGKPGYKTQASAEATMPLIPFQINGDIVKSNVPSGVCWGFNQNVEDPVAAMQLLNAMYTDSDLSNLLCWGEENKDYVITDEGKIKFPDGIDANTNEWNHNVQWEMPNECISHVWYTDTKDLWERMGQFNKNAAKSKALGFVWDNRQYSAQYTALQNVYDQYFKSLILGCLDPTTTIPEFVEKLKGAGSDEYIEAKRTALNAWAKANNVS